MFLHVFIPILLIVAVIILFVTAERTMSKFCTSDALEEAITPQPFIPHQDLTQAPVKPKEKPKAIQRFWKSNDYGFERQLPYQELQERPKDLQAIEFPLALMEHVGHIPTGPMQVQELLTWNPENADKYRIWTLSAYIYNRPLLTRLITMDDRTVAFYWAMHGLCQPTKVDQTEVSTEEYLQRIGEYSPGQLALWTPFIKKIGETIYEQAWLGNNPVAACYKAFASKPERVFGQLCKSSLYDDKMWKRLATAFAVISGLPIPQYAIHIDALTCALWRSYSIATGPKLKIMPAAELA